MDDRRLTAYTQIVERVTRFLPFDLARRIADMILGEWRERIGRRQPFERPPQIRLPKWRTIKPMLLLETENETQRYTRLHYPIFRYFVSHPDPNRSVRLQNLRKPYNPTG